MSPIWLLSSFGLVFVCVSSPPQTQLRSYNNDSYPFLDFPYIIFFYFYFFVLIKTENFSLLWKNFWFFFLNFCSKKNWESVWNLLSLTNESVWHAGIRGNVIGKGLRLGVAARLARARTMAWLPSSVVRGFYFLYLIFFLGVSGIFFRDSEKIWCLGFDTIKLNLFIYFSSCWFYFA